MTILTIILVTLILTIAVLVTVRSLAATIYARLGCNMVRSLDFDETRHPSRGGGSIVLLLIIIRNNSMMIITTNIIIEYYHL